ncbi:MAG: 50S ribosomal protein L2, partial [Nitrospirota bacterium]
MAIKLYKPTSPGRRFQTSTTFEELTRKEPYEGLLVSLPRTG